MKKPKDLYVGSNENSEQIAYISKDYNIYISTPIIPYRDQIRRLQKWLTKASLYIEYLDKKGLR